MFANGINLSQKRIRFSDDQIRNRIIASVAMSVVYFAPFQLHMIASQQSQPQEQSAVITRPSDEIYR